MSTTTDEYLYSAPDFGGVAERHNDVNQTPANATGAQMTVPDDDPLRSVLDRYKAPSTPSGLPPHIPTPPELANRRLGHKEPSAPSDSSSTDSNDNTSSRASKSRTSLPPPVDISADSLKNAKLDIGFIEKVGTTAMQSEQEKSKSNSRLGFGLNKSRATDSASPDEKGASPIGSNNQSDVGSKATTQSQRGASGKPQKGEAGYEEPHEEEQGAARGEGVPSESNSTQDQNQNGDQANGGQQGQDDGYPEQRHAGKLEGVGPEYGMQNRVTVFERLQGVKEQVKGTILRKPDVKQHGKERMTGELKKKEKEEADKADPFGNAPDDKSEKPSEGGGGDDENKEDNSDAPPKGNADSPTGEGRKESSSALNDPRDTKDASEQQDAEAGLSEVPQAHPTEKGKVEQAANVHPEGSKDNVAEERAHENATTGQVTGNQ